MPQQESVLENKMDSILWDLDLQTDHLISARRADLVLINKKKKKKKKKKQTNGFAVLWILLFRRTMEWKLKKGEKTDKYLDLARRTEKLLNMKVKVILIVVGALETVPKNLEKRQEQLEINGKIETIQTKALLWWARILRRVLETWRDF